MPQNALTPGALFRVLGDETRLRILHLIGEREVCVCYFVECLGVPQPKISRHLATLRGAGIVRARRDGKWMHYRMAELNAWAAAVVRLAIDSTRQMPAAKRDMARFTSACCTPTKSMALHSAPAAARPIGRCS